MSRIITELHPELQLKIAQLIDLCQKQGLKIGISECVRTVSEQDALYAQGRTTKGNIVTNAKGTTYSSMHQWGVAADFYRNDGNGAYNDTDGFFSKVGNIGRFAGLEWGGEWKSPVDKPHFQLPQWGSTAAKLKSAYGTPDKFMITWSKVNTTPISQQNPTDILKQQIKTIQIWLMQYTGHNLVIDGVYGKNTRLAAIKAVQRSIGLVMNGIYDNTLYSKIPTVKKGTTGNLVKCLESLLYIHGYDPKDFTGVAGDNVISAVKLFQQNKKLAVDGLAGKNTFKELIS